jgi:hypothetical protein
MAHKLIRNVSNRIYKIISPSFLNDKEGSEKIIDLLNSDKPCMISRFGSTELQTLCYEKTYPWLLPLKKRTYHNIQYCSGFFPVGKKNISKFYAMYMDDIKEIDVLITWRVEECFFRNRLKHAVKINKKTLDEFFNQQYPWTQALKGKDVLVIHPFAETIEEQYLNNRQHLFENPLVLPEFKLLKTIKAVQSIAGNTVNFTDWFEALEYMKTEIDKCDFEVAILGCGAYGMPLAAYIKRLGKKSVHLGGITQLLFGIKGKIYCENEITKNCINEFFVEPKDMDRPKNAEIVEGGCYW